MKPLEKAETRQEFVFVPSWGFCDEAWREYHEERNRYRRNYRRKHGKAAHPPTLIPRRIPPTRPRKSYGVVFDEQGHANIRLALRTLPRWKPQITTLPENP